MSLFLIFSHRSGKVRCVYDALNRNEVFFRVSRGKYLATLCDPINICDYEIVASLGASTRREWRGVPFYYAVGRSEFLTYLILGDEANIFQDVNPHSPDHA